MTTNPKYIAGWNLPGCIPEMEPAEFDTHDEAFAFLLDEASRAATDAGEELDWIDFMTELSQLPQSDLWTAPDGYVWWIEISAEDQ